MSKPSLFKLLAIDNDPRTLALISETLGDDGLEILTAEDAEAGFETFLRTRPRIVLLNLLMKEMSGMDAIVNRSFKMWYTQL